MDVDLVVIGGGAAGLAAAREGVRRGARTVLVSEGEPGGDCTFTGCVPSKTLLAAAAQGLAFSDAMRRVRETVAHIASLEDETALRGEGIAVVRGFARFIGRRRIDVDGRSLSGRRVVIATGASPVLPAVEGLLDADPLTSDDVFDVRERPDSVVVLGGGAIGCELAQAFARFGTRVTLLEAADRLLPSEEPDASTIVRAALERDGVDVLAGREATKVERVDAGLRVHTGDGGPVEAARIVVAAGRRATSAGMDLDVAGVAVTDDAIVTDARLRTTARGISAAGDVTGRVAFTHAADEMGRIAAANVLSRRRGRRYREELTPHVVYTDPEVARVGLTEPDAVRVRGARVACTPMTDVDRARTDGDLQGYVKLIAGPRRVLGTVGGGRLIGATIVGARAGALIHEPALALTTGMFVGRMAQTVHAYPTRAVAIRQTAAAFVGRGRTTPPMAS